FLRGDHRMFRNVRAGPAHPLAVFGDLAPRFKANDASLYVFLRKTSNLPFRTAIDVAEAPQTSSGGNAMATIERSGRMMRLVSGFRRMLPYPKPDLWCREGSSPAAVSTGQSVEPLDASEAPAREVELASVRKMIAQYPLMLDEKTYNTAHPDYDHKLVRNFP